MGIIENFALLKNVKYQIVIEINIKLPKFFINSRIYSFEFLNIGKLVKNSDFGNKVGEKNLFKFKME